MIDVFRGCGFPTPLWCFFGTDRAPYALATAGISLIGSGRAEIQTGPASVRIEVRSFNNRHLDVALKLTHGFESLEERIRGVIAETGADIADGGGNGPKGGYEINAEARQQDRANGK